MLFITGLVWAATLGLLYARRGAHASAARWAVLAGFVASWGAFANYHIDDAGISYAYARNLATGVGPRAFLGGAAVEGYSNPLWVALLAVGEVLGVPATIASKALSLACALASLLLVRRVVRASGGAEPEAVCAMAAAAASAPWVLWSAAGLENPLLALLLLCAVVVSIEGRSAVALGLLCGLVTATRPEGAALAAALVCGDLAASGRDGWRRAAVAGSVALCIAAVCEAARFEVFGVWAPNTFYAKLQFPGWLRRRIGWAYLANAYDGAGGAWVAAGFAGALLVGRRGAALAVLSPVAAGAAFAVYAGGDWMPLSRFASHLAPLVAAVAAPGLFVGARWLRDRTPRFRHPLRVVAPALCVAACLCQAEALDDARRHPICPLSGVRRMGELFRAVGPSMCGESEASAATPDIGGVMLLSPAIRVVDLAGLIEPDARGPMREPGYWRRRLARPDHPQIVYLHDPWVGATGLDDRALAEAGYRLICRGARAGDRSGGLYVRIDCAGSATGSAADALRGFCGAAPL